jgi:23S rRNA pseudouridine2605 synthase
MNQTSTEKLQKVLARRGLGSRRDLEEWISAGRVKVNGRMAKLGDRVGPHDVINVDGRIIPHDTEDLPTRVILYHKRIGEICTRRDEQDRPTVFGELPVITQGRWVGVGRLEVNTAGLLLFTNNGELAQQLMNPKRIIEQEYAVRVLGEMSDDSMTRLIQGIKLEDGMGHFERLLDSGGKGANHWYRVIINENRPRFIRRMLESQGLVLSRLIRVRFGPLELPRDLPQGAWMELPGATIKQLKKL